MEPLGEGARDGAVSPDHRSSRILAPGQCRFGWIDFPAQRLRARRAAKPNQCARARGSAAFDGRAATTYPGAAANGRSYGCPNQRADAYSLAAATPTTKLVLPAYAPAAGVPTPDFPASPAGLQAGYRAYPKTLVKSVPQPPGLGGDVTALTSLPFPPSPPLEENSYWQAVNKELNATVKMRMVPSRRLSERRRHHHGRR